MIPAPTCTEMHFICSVCRPCGRLKTLTEDEAKGNAHACRRWAEETARSLLPQSLSSYQNYADCGEKNRAQRLENYFGKANIQRLKELKEEYDPLGTFTREHFRL